MGGGGRVERRLRAGPIRRRIYFYRANELIARALRTENLFWSGLSEDVRPQSRKTKYSRVPPIREEGGAARWLRRRKWRRESTSTQSGGDRRERRERRNWKRVLRNEVDGDMELGARRGPRAKIKSERSLRRARRRAILGARRENCKNVKAIGVTRGEKRKKTKYKRNKELIMRKAV